MQQRYKSTMLNRWSSFTTSTETCNKNVVSDDNLAGSCSSSLQLLCSCTWLCAHVQLWTSGMCRDKAMLPWWCLICIFTWLFSMLYIVCICTVQHILLVFVICASPVTFLWTPPCKSSPSLLICFGAWAGLKKTEIELKQLQCGWTACSSVQQTYETEHSDKRMKDNISCLPLRVWMTLM